MFSESDGSPQDKARRQRSRSRDAAPGPAAVQRASGSKRRPLARSRSGSPLPDKTDWVGHLRGFLAANRLQLSEARRRRPLIVHGGFVGMGSHGQVLRLTGVSYQETCAAEPKSWAKLFLQGNGLMADHHFNDLAVMAQTAAPARGQCARCGVECDVPDERPDVFFAGFSCQAFSTMRASNTRAVPPTAHAKYAALPLTVRYLKARQPRAALLENTLGFGRAVCEGPARSPGGADSPTNARSGLQWLRDELQDCYHADWVQLDLQSWCNVKRPRYWIFLVHKDVGGPDIVRRARELAAAIQNDRRQYKAADLRDYMRQPGSAAWARDVLPSPYAMRPAWRESRPSDPEASEAKWQKQARERRAAWKAAGHPWHAAHPLAGASLHGLSGTEREREVLEVFLLEVCHLRGLSPLDPQQLARAKVGLTADISQNLTWLRPAYDGGGHSGCGYTAAVYCTESKVYSFQDDRLLLPVELLGSLGWVTPTTAPRTEGLTSAQLQNLVGESQALPCLAAATWALLLAVWSEGNGG